MSAYVDTTVGRSSLQINVPFLNLMSNLVRRAGRVNVRVGGNTQETAVMVQNTTSGRLLQKDYNNTLGTVSRCFLNRYGSFAPNDYL